MVVDDLDVFSAGLGPTEANPELIIDAYAVLTSSVALERFESIAWGDPQVKKPFGDLQLPQFAPRYGLETEETSDAMTFR